MAEIRVRDLEVGQAYKFQVRAKNKEGGTSAWSMLFNVSTNSDIISPNPVTLLTWSVSDSSFVATWIAPTQDSNGKDLFDLKDYKVVLTANSESVTYYVPQERFNFSFEMNVAAFGDPEPEVQISVQARDLTGNLSTAVTSTASNPIPSDVTGLDTIATLGAINVSWNNIPDNDLKYYEVYVGTSSGFTPSAGNLKYQGSSNNFTYVIDSTSTQYFKVRAVDIFNQGSANYAVDSNVPYPLDGPVDTTPPSQPSAPSVSVGTLVAQVSHAMTKQAGGNLEADVDHLEVHVSQSSGFTPSTSTLYGTIDSAGQGITVSAAFYFPTADSMTNLYWKVIAVDRAKNKSTASNQTSGLPGLILNQNILSATITDAKIQNLSAAKLIAGTAIINDLFVESILTVSDTGVIQSENYISNSNGWMINADGNAEFNDVIVRGEFIAQSGSALTHAYVINPGVAIVEVSSSGGTVELQAAAGGTSPHVLLNKILGGSGSVYQYLELSPYDNYSMLEYKAPTNATPSSYGSVITLYNNNTGIVLGGSFDSGFPGGKRVAYWHQGTGFMKSAVSTTGSITSTENWKTLTNSNGWNGGFYKLHPDGTVHLDGTVTAGTQGNGTIIGVLPSGYRPRTYTEFPVARPGDNYLNKIAIELTGEIRIFVTPNVTPVWTASLGSVSFSVLST